MMKRREMLIAGGSAILGLSTFRFGWTAPAEKKRQKVLYFTKSSGYEHSVVHREGKQLAFSEKILTKLGEKAGFDVECTKDGGVFDGDLGQYDLFAFYATGNLHEPGGGQNAAGHAQRERTNSSTRLPAARGASAFTPPATPSTPRPARSFPCHARRRVPQSP